MIDVMELRSWRIDAMELHSWRIDAMAHRSWRIDAMEHYNLNRLSMMIEVLRIVHSDLMAVVHHIADDRSDQHHLLPSW